MSCWLPWQRFPQDFWGAWGILGAVRFSQFPFLPFHVHIGILRFPWLLLLFSLLLAIVNIDPNILQNSQCCIRNRVCCFCICKPKGIPCWLCIAENAAGLERGTAWRLQGMEAVSSAWCFQACKSERAVARLIMNADLWHYAGIFRDWGLNVWKDVNRDAFEDCHMLPSWNPHSIFFSLSFGVIYVYYPSLSWEKGEKN